MVWLPLTAAKFNYYISLVRGPGYEATTISDRVVEWPCTIVSVAAAQDSD